MVTIVSDLPNPIAYPANVSLIKQQGFHWHMLASQLFFEPILREDISVLGGVGSILDERRHIPNFVSSTVYQPNSTKSS